MPVRPPDGLSQVRSWRGSGSGQRARFWASSSWPIVSSSSLMSSQASRSRAALVMAVAESGTAKIRLDLNVRPDDPHSFTKDSIRVLVPASPASLSSPITASVSCGRSGMSFERSGKNRRSRNFGPSRKRSSVVFRTRASIALGATAPRRVTRIWLRFGLSPNR